MKAVAFTFLIITLTVVATAVPLPEQPIPGVPYVRIARANPHPKADLEGSESAYIAYPYYYPSYWSHYYWGK